MPKKANPGSCRGTGEPGFFFACLGFGFTVRRGGRRKGVLCRAYSAAVVAPVSLRRRLLSYRLTSAALKMRSIVSPLVNSLRPILARTGIWSSRSGIGGSASTQVSEPARPPWRAWCWRIKAKLIPAQSRGHVHTADIGGKRGSHQF